MAGLDASTGPIVVVEDDPSDVNAPRDTSSAVFEVFIEESEPELTSPVDRTAATAPAVRLAGPRLDELPAPEESFPPPPPALPEGTLIDARFRVLGLVGRGGMAEVYRVQDEGLGGGQLALKLLHLPSTSDEVVKRFRQEMRICKALKHPLLVETHHFGAWDELLYFTMELLRGETVRQHLNDRRGSPLPLAHAVAIARQAALGLQVAHVQGVVHRDIKPDNLFLCDGGRSVKVLDFGVALSAEISARLSATGTTPGTPAYLAPERIRGKDASPASDLWALGVVLFEMVCGRKPFTGRRVTTLMLSIRDEPPPRPSELNPLVPPELERLMLALLDKEPTRRPASARRLAEQLADIPLAR